MFKPQIRHSSVRGLELLDDATIVSLTDKVTGDETGRPMDLRNLIGQHITIVVVSGHTKATIRPSNQLHRRSIRYQMLQITTRTLQKSSLIA